MSLSTLPGETSDYADRVARHVPGLRDLHRMAGLLLGEGVPGDGRVLVLGAGGGLELRAFAEMHPGWLFDGVDPSVEMIDQAKMAMAGKPGRCVFHHGYIEAAPEGPFDGAACLLTLHFLERRERLRTLRQLHRRLVPDAPFVVAHHSFPQSEGQQDLWLRRNANMLASAGVAADLAKKSVEALKDNLPALSPEEDEAILHEAGFRDIQLFYAGFTFKGWVCYASGG